MRVEVDRPSTLGSKIFRALVRYNTIFLLGVPIRDLFLSSFKPAKVCTYSRTKHDKWHNNRTDKKSWLERIRNCWLYGPILYNSPIFMHYQFCCWISGTSDPLDGNVRSSVKRELYRIIGLFLGLLSMHRSSGTKRQGHLTMCILPFPIRQLVRAKMAGKMGRATRTGNFPNSQGNHFIIYLYMRRQSPF